MEASVIGTEDDGDDGMLIEYSVLDCGDGGAKTGVLGVGDDTGTGDALGECGMGDGDKEGVDVSVVGVMAMDGDVPRLN